jgi:RimJ/RimL family protein N-acetyltransferase
LAVPAENKAAQKLFQRLGFRQEADFVEHIWFKGAWGSEYVFAMLQREWLARPHPHHSSPPDAQHGGKVT